MHSPPLARARLASPPLAVALALAVCAILLLAAAAPASAVTRKQAAKSALAALGVKKSTAPVVVLGLKASVPKGTRITVAGPKKRSKLAIKFAKQRAFFFYKDSGRFQLFPHAGRVVLVGAKSGKVKISRRIMWAPLVNGKLPPFLQNVKSYRSPQFRVYTKVNVGDPPHPTNNGNQPPKADAQSVTAKMNRPKRITLTGDDADGDLITFEITRQPSHGTLSGQPPDVTYTPDPGYLGADDFSFKTNDGDHLSNQAKVSITVTPPGLPPIVATSSGCTAYNEQGPAVVIDGEATVTDPDDTTLDSARVRIPQPPLDPGEDPSGSRTGDQLLFTDQNGITGSYDEITGVLDLTGTSSVANYQAALRSVRYRNLADSNPPPTKDVFFRASDAGNDSAEAMKQICISSTGTGGNDRPTGEPSEGALSYIENDGPVPADGGFVVGDPDSPDLSGATIKFVQHVSQPVDENGDPTGPPVVTDSFAPAEDELAFTDQNGITGSYNDTTGEMTLSGTSSVANYEAAMRSVTYENSSERPSDLPRRLRFQVTDSAGATSIAKTRDIFVTPVNDAPFVTTSEGSASYFGNSSEAATIDSDLTAGDVDDDNLESAQVKITSGFESGDELVFSDQNGISGSYDSETGVLSLTGTATIAEYQTALRSVGFRHTEGNAAGSRTVEFTVNDGDLDSAPATRGIEVNDKPVLDTTDTALAYTENDGAVAVDNGITATDADSPTLTGATVTISSNYVQGEDLLALAEQNGISGTFDSDTGTLTLTGTATVAQYQAALGDVRYQNNSESPSIATRTVTFQADDGGSSNNLSDPVTRDIEITSVNDAPVVTTSEGSTTYTIGDSEGVSVDTELAVTDVDDTNLETASVRVATGFEAGDELVFEDQNGISGSYDSETGVLSLTGPASVGEFETALRSIKYRSTAETPTPGSRTVEFTVNDGDDDSEVASKTVDVEAAPTDIPPVVTTSPGTTSHTVGDTEGQPVDPDLTVSDADDTDLESGHVQIDGFEPGDELVFADQNGISGTYDSEIGVLTVTGTSSVANYETALRSVRFRHFGDNQSAFRTVAFKVNDGDLDSPFALKLIDVVAAP